MSNTYLARQFPPITAVRFVRRYLSSLANSCPSERETTLPSFITGVCHWHYIHSIVSLSPCYYTDRQQGMVHGP
jgi:hypothetical protein